jgi:hypothetical protein
MLGASLLAKGGAADGQSPLTLQKKQMSFPDGFLRPTDR